MNDNISWEVTICGFRDNGGRKYKVTRRLPEFKLAETKVFDKKEDAEKQFNEWLKDDQF